MFKIYHNIIYSYITFNSSFIMRIDCLFIRLYRCEVLYVVCRIIGIYIYLSNTLLIYFKYFKSKKKNSDNVNALLEVRAL